LRPVFQSRAICGLALLLLAGCPGRASEFPAPFNTQSLGTNVLVPADQVAASLRLPDGFKATVFAAEPDVQNPIALTTDPHGRLWVAENYTYAERDANFDHRLRDRIVVLEDRDHDGRFDQRTVFWDQARLLTSVELGFGGVWALCPPQLLFIPDRNGDDVPDGEPEVVLDGWNDSRVRHNVANGLKWGPDGWLYGRHGILANSLVGRPGASDTERKRLNCAIWRYHPTRKVFEVVAQGTTNPWGMDWDEHGQAFFINTVIGHLWQVIPGAHYKRMYGEDLDPDTFELIDQHADHFHWDTRESWDDIRKLGVTDTTSRAGGGHAHSGLMIYQGDNWPARYRGRLVTVNFHGRRLNVDRLERKGSGYVGRHEPDLLFVNDPWFRGIDLVSGADGGVFLADWSDIGECHENDGVHRTSGRIFKITYGQPDPPPHTNLAVLGDGQLVGLQTSSNDWLVRQSRQLLQQRAGAGRDPSPTTSRLLALFVSGTNEVNRLRALWALHAVGGASDEWLRQRLNDRSEHVRVWAVRLLTDSGTPDESTLKEFVRLGREEPSPMVRLFLASALQRLPAGPRVELARALLKHAEDARDQNLPLMLWYGVAPLATMDPDALARLAGDCAIPQVRRFIARRLSQDLAKNLAAVEELLRQVADSKNEGFQLDVLNGLGDGLAGQRKARRPAGWEAVQSRVTASANPALRDRARDLSALFGDGRALEELRRIALDPAADLGLRRTALQSFIETGPADQRAVCEQLLAIHELCIPALQGLTAFNDPAIAARIVQNFPRYYGHEQQAAISTLASRPVFAKVLVEAIANGDIKRQQVSAYYARQIRGFGDAALTAELGRTWGEVRDTATDKREIQDRHRKLLDTQRLARANASEGRALFNQLCANCHVLFGHGALVGPDLTGAGRDNLDYLLENIVDPSAVVGEDFRMITVTLKDGRVLTGTPGPETERTLSVQGVGERMTVEREEIRELTRSELSLMPEGLLEALSEEQTANLFSYLMSKQQVPLPEGKAVPQ